MSPSIPVKNILITLQRKIIDFENAMSISKWIQAG